MISKLLRFLDNHTYLLYITLLILTLITLGLTLLPQEVVTGPDVFSYDKLGHFLIFGLWTFLLGLTLFVSGQHPLPLFSIFLAGSLFGISIEILQEVLPFNRNLSLYDVLANMAGCLTATLLLKSLTRYAPYDRKVTEQ